MKAMSRNGIAQAIGVLVTSMMLAASGPAASHPHPDMTPGAGGSQSVQSRYMQQRQACLSGATGQDRDTCLREAAAARQAALRGNLATRREETYLNNRTQRCSRLPQADRDECIARMAHPTDMSGSVADGGVLYEYREIVPAGTPGSRVIPGSSVEPAAVVTPGGQVKPGVVVEIPAGSAKPAR